MSYQVLARKWRPRNFHELVGQEHVSRALVNALDQGRLHHAYLFTGTRGVGKTTLARILAKCLNCEQGVTSQPCGQCETCHDIDNGRFVDLIEVDAASRTKVEDTRELLDNVQYAPTQGRYKVYLIDEVHMLSTHSFNALLKTLEEPPPHVKFLLATTDPQKLPVTVLSRCLQFTLKNMPPERVVEHLTHVLEAEQVAFDSQALWLLGKAADGSMRDAMSLTDQAIAFGQGEVRREDVAAMLGTLDHAHLIALTQALADVDAERLLAEVASLAEQGPDFAGVLDELSGLMHRLAIAQMVPAALDNGHGDRDELLALAGRFTAEDVQLYYQIALQGRGDIANAPDARSAVEMTLLRMLAFRPQGVPTPPQTDLPLRVGQQGGQQGGEQDGGSQGATSVNGVRQSDAEPMAVAPESADSLASSTMVGSSPPSVAAEQEVAAAESAAASTFAVPRQGAESASDSAGDRPPWAVDDDAVSAEVAPAETTMGRSTSEPATLDQSAMDQSRRQPSSEDETRESASFQGGASSNDAPGFDPVSRRDDESGVNDESGLNEDAAFSDETYAWAGAADEIGGGAPHGSTLGDAPAEVLPGAEEAQATTRQGVVHNAMEPGATGLDGAIPRDAVQAPSATSEPIADAMTVLPGRVPTAFTGNDSSTRQDAPASTGELTHALWLERFEQLDIGGLTRNLAAHCVIEGDDGGVLRMTLDPGQSAMLSELHVDRITKALAGIGYTRRLDISVAELDGRRETAKAKRDREVRERHARAVEALRIDPHIQELEARFGARLMEGSVTADRV